MLKFQKQHILWNLTETTWNIHVYFMIGLSQVGKKNKNIKNYEIMVHAQ